MIEEVERLRAENDRLEDLVKKREFSATILRERDEARAEVERLRRVLHETELVRDQRWERAKRAEARLAVSMRWSSAWKKLAQFRGWPASKHEQNRRRAEQAEAEVERLRSLMAPGTVDVGDLLRRFLEANKEVERLRKAFTEADQAVMHWIGRVNAAEARLAEETKAQDEAVRLLHKQIEDLVEALREISEKDGANHCGVIARAALAAAKPETKLYDHLHYCHSCPRQYGCDQASCRTQRDLQCVACATAQPEEERRG